MCFQMQIGFFRNEEIHNALVASSSGDHQWTHALFIRDVKKYMLASVWKSVVRVLVNVFVFEGVMV